MRHLRPRPSGFPAFERIARDLRYGWRGLRRTPGFTLVAIVTLALGIGANTTFFGLVDAIVFRPTSIARLDRVFAITMHVPPTMMPVRELQTADFRALAAAPPDSVAAIAGVSGALSQSSRLAQVPGRAEFVRVETITSGYPDVFGLYAQTGRWISADEDRDGAKVAVISDRLWRTWFGADRAIVGRATVGLGPDRPYTIVGVAPPGFRGVQTSLAGTDVWLPLGPPPPPRAGSRFDPYKQYDVRYPGMETFVRLKPGVTASQAAGSLRAIVGGQPNPDPAAGTLDLMPGAEALRIRELVALAAGILAFSGLVFLAACANLANMLYARGSARTSEIAVRMSLGAGTGNILSLFVAEAAIIALLAAAIGLLLAIGATSAFTAAFPTFRLAQNLGVTIDLSPDYRVFFYAFGAGALAALVIGLLTAWRSGRVPVIRALASGGTATVVSASRRGLPLTFVSIQITAAVLLLIGAGLFLENTRPALDRRVHYDTSRLAAARIQQVDAGGANTIAGVDLATFRAMTPAERRTALDQAAAAGVARRAAFFTNLVTRARALPGVEAASLVDAFPGGTAPAPNFGKSILQAATAPQNYSGLPRRLDGSWVEASPEFLDTIGLHIRRGRGLQPTDVRDTPRIAVLSQSAADALWPGEDPIGKTMNCCLFQNQPITVVGVVDDPASSSDTSPWTRYANFVFLAAAQGRADQLFLVVRAENPAGQTDAMRAVVRSLDEHAPVFDAGPVDEFLLAGVAIQRAERTLTTSLGALALGIAMLGIYAVVSYFVSRRTREFGLRIALGAVPRQILKLVVDYAVHIILIGLLPGVLIASLATRLFEHQLFGIMPNGITMWVVAPLLMFAAGVVAGLVPAQRAARVDPNITLRNL